MASFVATLLIFLILLLPFGFVVSLVVRQLIDVVSTMNADGILSVFSAHEFFQTHLEPWVDKLEASLGISVNLAQIMTTAGREVARYVYNFSPQVVGLTASFILSFFVMHMGIYFLFIEGPSLIKLLLDLSPLEVEYEKRLTGEVQSMLRATVYGYFLTGLVQAFLAGIGFWIVGLPALVLATITFFMSMVPIIGATAVWLPVSLWLFLQGHNGQALFIFIYGIALISGIDNFIKPLIIRGQAKMHILLIFLSLLGGLQFFGPIGILLGPVLISLFVACIRIYRRDFI